MHLKEIFLGLCLTVTEISIKKVQKQHSKNMKRCRDGMQKYAKKVRMMHESKGQHIGKAPFLHLFHTIAEGHTSLIPRPRGRRKWPENEATAMHCQ